MNRKKESTSAWLRPMNSGVTVQHDTDFNTDVKKKEKRSAEVLPPKRCQRSSRFRDGSGALVRFTLPVPFAVK